ncbi:hypothetical protein B0H63DRAFT_475292 [Podospora didyma]|uniref:CHY-type domain-containing protein n=1 Tax=Podospora didyma TaxID=330526 RepID=A0AAE0NGU0_9PEZI|nr:hypothetical protein B0H63DRAFT_475292 [Podospora didyma]
MIPIRTKDGGGDQPRSSRQAVGEAAASRVVPKPVPERQVRNAREYQIEQLRRRFSPKESTLGNGDTSFFFGLKPSDPDFAFDLDRLQCDLRVPAAYPAKSPRLLVKNTDIPRGFAINIERGWDKLVEERRGTTLLSLTNALDKKLESLLSEQKAETVTLMTFQGTKDDRGQQEPPQKQQAVASASKPPPARRPYVPDETFSRDQIAEARARRAQEVRQLEARMGRLPLYQRSGDGIVYTLPIEPKRRAMLPVGLRPVQSVQLIIPLLYPLQPLRILFNDAESKEAEPVEELFSKRAMEQKQMSLTSHVNYLAQNLHILAKQAQAHPPATAPLVEAPSVLGKQAEEAEHSATLDAHRGHLNVIPRPPEWTLDDGSEEESDSSDDAHSHGDEDEDGEGGGAAIESGSVPLPTQTVERGIAMSFPTIELYGIELLQVAVLNLSVKCARCKTLNEITDLKDIKEKSGSCRKCATPFTVRFRQELIHQNSTRAGFIDASGWTVADLLPSTFVPTCSKCSTPSQGLVSVRGETTTNVCRECHSRFTFKIPEVKFLAYAPGSDRLPPTSGPKRRQEKLGLHAGEQLPDKGTCKHYKRSYRWFRFSCCSKVFPCDRCHDEAENHINEWANRMICGYCSREQNYSVESCTFCGRSVIGKRGTGYWEGGKGTRSQVLMRRGDKRKFRRIGGGGGGDASKKKDGDAKKKDGE